MRRLLFVAACILVSLSIAYLVLWLMVAPFDREFNAKYEKLQIGMTEQEAVEILGGAAQGYFIVISSNPGEQPSERHVKTWNGRCEERITLHFDQNGVLKSKDFATPEDDASYFGPPETTFDKLRRWLGV